jgi:hypothetical protein
VPSSLLVGPRFEWRWGSGTRQSSFCKLLKRDELPRQYEIVDAFLDACGAREEDKQAFATAGRRLSMKRSSGSGRLRAVSGAPVPGRRPGGRPA